MYKITTSRIPVIKYNSNNAIYKRQLKTDQVVFSGLIPDNKINNLKMCVYDLDETLLEGSQSTRNNVLKFSTDKNRTLVYASARSIKKVLPLIENGTLTMPDYVIGDNGLSIYKRQNDKLVEIKSWSSHLAKEFNKGKIREFMLDIANQYKFDDPEFVKKSNIDIPEGQKDFAQSKITEYETFYSPLNISFMMSPGIYKKIKDQIETQIKTKNIKAEVAFQTYDKNNVIASNLVKYFGAKLAMDIENLAKPRLNDEGGVYVIRISAQADKGKAVEYLRKESNITPDQIFAAGDAENDFSNTNKGYFFALLANATDGLKQLVSKLPDTGQIIKTTKEGVEGIWECIES